MDKTKVGQFPSLFQTVQGFVNPKDNKNLAVSVEFEKGLKAKTSNNRGRVSSKINFEELGEGIVGAKV